VASVVLNVALVGAGRMGTIHAASIARHPGARLVSIADRDGERASGLAERHGAEATTETEAAITSDAVDAVVVASSTDTHVELVELAASAGKAIFSEKPLALDSERGARCLEVVDARGALLQVGFNRRFDPSFRGVKAAIDEGRIGKVELVVLTSRDPELPPPGYIETSGGLFRDFAIHDFDTARWLLSEEPIEVVAFGSNLVDPSVGAAGDVDTAMTLLRTASGALCHINNSRRAVYGYDQRIEVHGSLGMAQAGDRTPASVVVTTGEAIHHSLPHRWFPQRYAEAYEAEMAAFIEAATNGTPALVTGLDAVRAGRLADAAQESLEMGRPVAVGG
jgi:myo-inositol 2-dehydrogenase/D-chiro-inositol 1-dehydrogenase